VVPQNDASTATAVGRTDSGASSSLSTSTDGDDGEAAAAASDECSSSSRFSLTRPRKHKCTYCTKAFVTPSKLKRHERTHTGEKPFGCDHCAQRFTQRCGLKVHSHLHARELLSGAGTVGNMRASCMTAEDRLASEINGFVVADLISAMQQSSSRRATTNKSPSASRSSSGSGRKSVSTPPSTEMDMMAVVAPTEMKADDLGELPVAFDIAAFSASMDMAVDMNVGMLD